MNLSEALIHLKEGKKIRRKAWFNSGVFLFIDDELHLYYLNSKTWNCPDCDNILAGDDILADDWEIVE